MVSSLPLILGTRGSRLALAQTDLVLQALTIAAPNLQASPRIIKTSGDWKPEDGEKRLSEVEGGKGLFVKEIEQALIDGVIHAGVHSLKDVPSFLPDGLQVVHTLKRADPRDVFIARDGYDLMTLPSGSVVGTSSLRRQAMIKKLRPDLVVVPFRGNVPTRLEKVKVGQVDATILASAGIDRLGRDTLGTEGLALTLMDSALMLPACGQGIVGIETRIEDTETVDIMNRLTDRETAFCAMAERIILQILDGDCHTPIGAYATLTNGQMWIRALVATPDGEECYQAERQSTISSLDEVQALARDLGDDVRAHAPCGLLPERRTGT